MNVYLIKMRLEPPVCVERVEHKVVAKDMDAAIAMIRSRETGQFKYKLEHAEEILSNVVTHA